MGRMMMPYDDRSLADDAIFAGQAKREPQADVSPGDELTPSPNPDSDSARECSFLGRRRQISYQHG